MKIFLLKKNLNICAPCENPPFWMKQTNKQTNKKYIEQTKTHASVTSPVPFFFFFFLMLALLRRTSFSWTPSKSYISIISYTLHLQVYAYTWKLLRFSCLLYCGPWVLINEAFAINNFRGIYYKRPKPSGVLQYVLQQTFRP